MCVTTESNRRNLPTGKAYTTHHQVLHTLHDTTITTNKFTEEMETAISLVGSPTKNETAATTTTTTTLFVEAICRYLSDHYRFRMTLQKLEFSISWFLVAAIAVSNLEQTSSPWWCSMAETYLKGSVASRLVAYVFDFANARVKLGGTKKDKGNHHRTKNISGGNGSVGGLPYWLILHHSGVLVVHWTTCCFLMENSFVAATTSTVIAEHANAYTHQDPSLVMLQLHKLRIVACLLASQASHNTWTKPYSMALYWANSFGVGLSACAVGFVLGLLLPVQGLLEDDRGILSVVESIAASIDATGTAPWIGVQLFGISLTMSGMLKLVDASHQKSKERKMSRTSNKSLSSK